MLEVASYTQGMGKTFDIAVVRRALIALMDQQNIKPTTLSNRVGKSPTLVKDLLEKTNDAKLSTLCKLAGELGVPVEALLQDGLEPLPLGPRLHVKGEVAAGQWVEAYEWPEDDWKAMTGRPDISASEDQRYFLKVVGDSMNQLYPEGSYVECVSTFANIEITPGRKVVVLRQREDMMIEATIKELVEIDGEEWLVPRSNNPTHQAFKLNEPGDGILEIRIAAVVVGSVRPE